MAAAAKKQWRWQWRQLRSAITMEDRDGEGGSWSQLRITKCGMFSKMATVVIITLKTLKTTYFSTSNLIGYQCSQIFQNKGAIQILFQCLSSHKNIIPDIIIMLCLLCNCRPCHCIVYAAEFPLHVSSISSDTMPNVGWQSLYQVYTHVVYSTLG